MSIMSVMCPVFSADGWMLGWSSQEDGKRKAFFLLSFSLFLMCVFLYKNKYKNGVLEQGRVTHVMYLPPCQCVTIFCKEKRKDDKNAWLENIVVGYVNGVVCSGEEFECCRTGHRW